jgi:hypothetical protein
MIDVPHYPWLTAILAAALLFDALISIKPPAFIRTCLDGVGFPRDWWWALIVIKLAAAAGLVAGLAYPGVGFATTVAVIGYFLAAAWAHIRSGFIRHEFWFNCLGMLGLATITLVASYAGAIA